MDKLFPCTSVEKAMHKHSQPMCFVYVLLAYVNTSYTSLVNAISDDKKS